MIGVKDLRYLKLDDENVEVTIAVLNGETLRSAARRLGITQESVSGRVRRTLHKVARAKRMGLIKTKTPMFVSQIHLDDLRMNRNMWFTAIEEMSMLYDSNKWRDALCALDSIPRHHPPE